MDVYIIHTHTHTKTQGCGVVYLPHRRVWLWWCPPPAQGNRNTWRFESAPQSYSYYSSDGWPPPHTSPASPGMRLRETEKEKLRRGIASNRLLRWLIVTVSSSKTLKFKLEWMCAANNNQIYATAASPWIKQICWIIYFCINPSVYSGLTLFDS